MDYLKKQKKPKKTLAEVSSLKNVYTDINQEYSLEIMKTFRQ